MIMNDRKFVEEVSSFYDDEKNIHQNILFERSKIDKYKFDYVFNSIRLEDQNRYLEAIKGRYDYFAQIYKVKAFNN